MNPSRDRRLAKLERANLEQEPRPRARTIYLWRDAPRESAEQAVARRCPNGAPAGARLVICSWQSSCLRQV